MSGSHRLTRRGFLGGTAATALSVVLLPGIGRVQAAPHSGAGTSDYEGRLCYNENPLGPSQAAITALEDAATLGHRYPDWYNSGLEGGIASHLGVSASNICAGAGATEMIRLVADALLGPGDEMVTATPTYTQIGNEAVANGATVTHVPLTAEHVIDLDGIRSALGPETRMVSLVNPNNPLGTIVDRTDLEAFIAALPEGVVLVVDEAYHDYVHDPAYESCLRYVAEGADVVVIRTMSKAYGLAGVRVGYTVASSGLTSQIASSQLYGMISRPSQAAAEAALSDPAHVAATVALNDQARAALESGLTGLGLDWIPSHTNFLMFDTETSASAVASELGTQGYRVRTGWGMPQHIRVSTGTLAEVQGFLQALGSILATGVATEEIPHGLALAAVHPNPFNAACRLRVHVPTDEPLHLGVYDLTGRKVRVLERGRLGAGVHDLVWDGRDHAGREVASGTYVLNLVQGETVACRKIALVK